MKKYYCNECRDEYELPEDQPELEVDCSHYSTRKNTTIIYMHCPNCHAEYSLIRGGLVLLDDAW